MGSINADEEKYGFLQTPAFCGKVCGWKWDGMGQYAIPARKHIAFFSSWQILLQLRRDEDSSTSGDGIVLQKRWFVCRTSEGAECRTTCADVLDIRGLTSSGSSRQGRDSLHCSMYCSGVPSTGVTWRVRRSWRIQQCLAGLLLVVEYSILILFVGKMSYDDSLCMTMVWSMPACSRYV